MNRYQRELYHHGILGMHWGIRRYQKYGEGGYNPKKKGKFTGKEKPDEKKGLTDKQKKILIAAGIATVAVVGGYAVYKSGILNKTGLGRSIVKNASGSAPTLNGSVASELFGTTQSNKTQHDILKSVDPHHGNTNCGPVSMATVMQSKFGISVAAKDTGVTTWDNIREVFPDAKPHTAYIPDSLDDIGHQIKSMYKVGDEGIIDFRPQTGNVGHYMSFTVKDNGVYLREGQTTGLSNTFKRTIDSLEINMTSDEVIINGRTITGSPAKIIKDGYAKGKNLDLTQFDSLSDKTITDDVTVLNKYFEKVRS